MKKCLKCGQTYDDSLFFCLADGSSLVAIELSQTIAGQKSGVPAVLKYALVALVAMMFAGGAVVLVYELLKRPSRDEQPQNAVVNNSNIPDKSNRSASSPTPANAKTPFEIRGTQLVNSPTPTASNQAVKYFRVAQTSDGFTAVRAAPMTKSAEITRLSPGARIGCQETVKGELIGKSDVWRHCPSAGGYIYAQLLIPVE